MVRTLENKEPGIIRKLQICICGTFEYENRVDILRRGNAGCFRKQSPQDANKISDERLNFSTKISSQRFAWCNICDLASPMGQRKTNSKSPFCEFSAFRPMEEVAAVSGLQTRKSSVSCEIKMKFLKRHESGQSELRREDSKKLLVMYRWTHAPCLPYKF